MLRFAPWLFLLMNALKLWLLLWFCRRGLLRKVKASQARLGELIKGGTHKMCVDNCAAVYLQMTYGSVYLVPAHRSQSWLYTTDRSEGMARNGRTLPRGCGQ